MANPKTEGDGRSWKELIEGYNLPHREGDAGQCYQPTATTTLYYCPTCKLCYELIPNNYKKIYTCEHLDPGFPTRAAKDNTRDCPICNPDSWYWGCLGGSVKKRLDVVLPVDNPQE